MQIGLGISPTIPANVAIPFNPASISGLQLWLDASDSATLFTDSAGTTAATADGDPVGRWNDKSGNAKHATQSDGTAKPLLRLNYKNSKNVIHFDGSNDIMDVFNFSTITSVHFFLVIRPTFSTNYSRIVSWRKATNTNDVNTTGRYIACIHTPIVSNSSDVFSYVDNGAVFVSWTSETWGLFSSSNDSTTLVIRKNNTNEQSLTPSGFDRGAEIQIGGRRGIGNDNGIQDCCIVRFAEMLVYDTVLSANQSNLVCGYLNSKWSIY